MTVAFDSNVNGEVTMASSSKSASFLIESRMADAAYGDTHALYELGIAYSSGSGGVEVDLVQAH